MRSSRYGYAIRRRYCPDHADHRFSQRAIRPVERDPLTVLDWRSVDPAEVVESESRALSAVTESGEIMRGNLWHLPPKNPE